MTQRETILIHLLAATDALWGPNRANLPVISERREHFRAAGLQWSARWAGARSNEATRHGMASLFAELDLTPFIDTVSPSGRRVTSVRLSDAGDEYARALVGQATLADCIPRLTKLRDLRDDDRAAAAPYTGFVPEDLLAGTTWGDVDQADALARTQFELLPALVRGFARSSCSIRRHAWYALTPTGAAFLHEPVLPLAELPESSDDAWDLYASEVATERAALQTAKPSTEMCIGEIPMPVCPTLREHTA
jgi:hypothetical protein